MIKILIFINKVAKKIITVFVYGMNTIYNYPQNNHYNFCRASAVKFSGARTCALQKIASSALKTVDEIPAQVNKLSAEYFKKYNFTDKLLIKLGLKHDCSSQMAVFDFLGIKPHLTHDNYIVVESYGDLEQKMIAKMGLDEAKVFERVCRIRKNADFNNSSLNELKNLSFVGNNLYLTDSKIDRLGELNFVGRHVYINDKLSEEDFKNVYIHGCIL